MSAGVLLPTGRTHHRSRPQPVQQQLGTHSRLHAQPRDTQLDAAARAVSQHPHVPLSLCLQYTAAANPEWMQGIFAGVDLGLAVSVDPEQSAVPLTTGQSTKASQSVRHWQSVVTPFIARRRAWWCCSIPGHTTPRNSSRRSPSMLDAPAWFDCAADSTCQKQVLLAQTREATIKADDLARLLPNATAEQLAAYSGAVAEGLFASHACVASCDGVQGRSWR